MVHSGSKCGKDIREPLLSCSDEDFDSYGILSVFLEISDDHNSDLDPIIEGKA